MKYIILILTILSLGLIVFGYISDTETPEKYIGFGVAILFLLVFPLFSYYRWKGKDIKDYMITRENLDKMRENQKKNKY